MILSLLFSLRVELPFLLFQLYHFKHSISGVSNYSFVYFVKAKAFSLFNSSVYLSLLLPIFSCWQHLFLNF